MKRVSLAVNGVRHELDLEPRELLVYVLRDRLGLTGTNVGCDTSSCGACTVLLDGEAVKSCTLLGVQADGCRADHDRGPRLERRPAPAAAGVPRAARAPVRLLHARDGDGRGEPAGGQPRPERGRDPARARGQPLPLHRLPEHRRGRARGGSGLGGAMATTETSRPAVSSARPSPRKEDRKLAHRQRPVHRQHQPAGPALARGRAQPVRARADRQASTSRRRARLAGVVAAFSGAELAADWAGSLPCAWPVTEDIKMPSHFPLASTRRATSATASPWSIAESRALAKDAAELVEVEYEPLPAVADVEAGARRRRAARPRRPRHERVLRLEARRRRGRPGVRRRRRDGQARYRQQRLIPNAMEPRGATRPGAARHGELTLWTSTQIPHIARLTLAGVVGFPRRGCGWSPPTSAAASARSSTSTPRRRSASRSRARLHGR